MFAPYANFSPLTRGFSLVEALVVIALTAAIFGALFSSFYFTLELVNDSRGRLAALSLAQERLEYIRSLSYNDVGTIGGIPNGPIPQYSSSTRNGVEFSERVLIEFVDDPGDGILGSTTLPDINDIPNDYKRVKIEYEWVTDSGTSSFALVSNIVPPSIESNEGGGTVWVNVFGENSQPIPGIDVRLYNETTTTTIDVTRTTNANGIALFSGAPATSSYEVFASAAGYSSDQSYRPTTSHPYPVRVPFPVDEADVATVDLVLDRLSDLTITTWSSIVEGEVLEPFNDLSGVASSTNVDTALGGLVLADSGGIFEATGTAFLPVIEPSALLGWDTIRVGASTPVGTDYVVRLYTGSSTSGYTPIPDNRLPGNPIGFTSQIIDISDLDRIDFPAITVGIELATSDVTETPNIDEVAVYYRESEVPAPNTTVRVYGEEPIGSTPTILYTDETVVTNTTGRADLDQIRFDNYHFELPSGDDLARVCPGNPFELNAGVSETVELLLVPNTANTLRVRVQNGSRDPIPGAEVWASSTAAGVDQTLFTDNCGQVFFSGLAPASDYQIEVRASGFTPSVSTNYVVSGDNTLTAVLLDP